MFMVNSSLVKFGKLLASVDVFSFGYAVFREFANDSITFSIEKLRLSIQKYVIKMAAWSVLQVLLIDFEEFVYVYFRTSKSRGLMFEK